MSEINPDDLEIIKDILGPDDDDDPIFGKQKNNSNNNKISFSSKNPNQTSNIQSHNSSHSITLEPKVAPLTTKSASDDKIRTPSGPVQKCTSIYLGGPDVPVGMMTESSDPCVCSKLSCIKCDHNVLRFPNRRWKKSTDYLFLRNNFPENVQQNLIVAPGWCAYCCQCTFSEEKDLRKLPPYSSSWVCRGHR